MPARHVAPVVALKPPGSAGACAEPRAWHGEKQPRQDTMARPAGRRPSAAHPRAALVRSEHAHHEGPEDRHHHHEAARRKPERCPAPRWPAAAAWPRVGDGKRPAEGRRLAASTWWPERFPISGGCAGRRHCEATCNSTRHSSRLPIFEACAPPSMFTGCQIMAQSGRLVAQALRLALPEELGQPRRVHRDAPRLVGREHLCLARIGLTVAAVEIRQRLAVGVAHDVAAGDLVGAPGRREAAGCVGPCSVGSRQG